MTQTYGYRRKRDVPVDGGNAKPCARCDLWFSAGPRERVCFGCLKPAERAKRAANNPEKAQVGAAGYPGTRGGRNERQNAQVGAHSEVLNLTFKPSVPLWHIMALEKAAEERWRRR